MYPKTYPSQLKFLRDKTGKYKITLSQSPPLWRALPIKTNKIYTNKTNTVYPNSHFKNIKAMRTYSLVLSSRFIPHTLIYKAKSKKKTQEKAQIFVPALFEKIAQEELYLYIKENCTESLLQHSIQNSAKYALFFLLPFLLFHIIRMGWLYLPIEHMPDPEFWIEYGKLDAFAVKYLREYWRLVTALTLHADIQHILGNFLFSAIFLTILARRLGIGLSFFLALFAASLANILNVLCHRPPYSSIGFSTALFSIVGLICADTILCNKDKKNLIVLPLAAGLGILAMIGTQGIQTDYLAHIFGFFMGLLVGLVFSYSIHAFPHLLILLNKKIYQMFFTVFSFFILIYSWYYMFTEGISKI